MQVNKIVESFPTFLKDYQMIEEKVKKNHTVRDTVRLLERDILSHIFVFDTKTCRWTIG